MTVDTGDKERTVGTCDRLLLTSVKQNGVPQHAMLSHLVVYAFDFVRRSFLELLF